MLLITFLLVLYSNAITLRQDKAILYSRIVIIILLCCCIINRESLNLINLAQGIGIYGGLFHASSMTQVFHIFLFVTSVIILQLTGFYPLKV